MQYTLTLTDIERGAHMQIADCKARIDYFQRKLHAPRIGTSARMQYLDRLARLRAELESERLTVIAIRAVSRANRWER